MLKSISLSLLFGMISQAFTQPVYPKKEKTPFPPLRIAIGFSPDLNYRTLVNLSNNPFSDRIINLRNEREIPRIGYSTQLYLAVDITKKTSIEFGLGYKDMGFTYENMTVSKPNIAYIASLIDHFYYYSIPIAIRQTWGNKKWQFTYHLGLSTNIFRVQKTNIIAINPNIADTTIINIDGRSTYKDILLIPSVGLGTTYNINSKSQICFEPTLRYSISSITQNTPINGYLYNVGLNLSYKWKLN
jgi:hypothetical protein